MAGPLSKKGWRAPKESSIADLRHQVKLQTLDESTRDVSGQVVPTWVDGATYWARVEPVGGKETFASGQVQADVTHRVILRGGVAITAKMRFIWITGPTGANVLNVVTVLPTTGIANSLEVLCNEEV